LFSYLKIDKKTSDKGASDIISHAGPPIWENPSSKGYTYASRNISIERDPNPEQTKLITEKTRKLYRKDMTTLFL
jgi:hypothetical protein